MKDMSLYSIIWVIPIINRELLFHLTTTNVHFHVNYSIFSFYNIYMFNYTHEIEYF
jgi:hypothetical protein